jgi:hypothetical protein
MFASGFASGCVARPKNSCTVRRTIVARKCLLLHLLLLVFTELQCEEKIYCCNMFASGSSASCVGRLKNCVRRITCNVAGFSGLYTYRCNELH